MVYLNNSSTSYPKPKNVNDAVIEYLNSLPIDYHRSGVSHSDVDVITACRQKLATLFGVADPSTPERIAFSSGATESLNLALFGLDLQGGHIVSTVTEHNSVIRPLKL